MTFMPGNTAVENARRLAQSALPDAPVVEDDQREHRVRKALGALLRRRATAPSARRPAVSGKPAESC